nr:MAG TPA: hypothetical protein [Caudoviricetes sp.]
MLFSYRGYKFLFPLPYKSVSREKRCFPMNT